MALYIAYPYVWYHHKVYTMNPYPKPVKQEKKKPKRIKPRSDKRAKQEREYLEKRKKYLQDNPVCKFKGCNLEATTVHHPKGRLGKLLTDETNFLGLCMEHHVYVENNPNFAKANGYSLGRLSKI